MKKLTFIGLLLLFGLFGFSQQTATLKISEIHVDLNGKQFDPADVKEISLSDHSPATAIIFEDNQTKYGVEFQYKKGRNRIKLVRRGFATQSGSEPKYGKKRKDMQELKTSITGNFNKRVVDNIILSREKLEAINVSFKYELIYK